MAVEENGVLKIYIIYHHKHLGELDNVPQDLSVPKGTLRDFVRKKAAEDNLLAFEHDYAPYAFTLFEPYEIDGQRWRFVT